MYKRRDSDIFGTSQLASHPRIQNPSHIDPNAVFRKNVQHQYQAYSDRLGPIHQTITKLPLDASQVNQHANFSQVYHRQRKEKDLQSSIFYPPSAHSSVLSPNDNSENNPLAANRQTNFGRKETMKRQISQLASHEERFRGNASRLFDLEERVGERKKRDNQQIVPLIPAGMQWDQHDSVKYSYINCPPKTPVSPAVISNNVSEREVTQPSTEPLSEKTVPEQKREEVKSEKTSQTNCVEVKILKGWDCKFMEGLAKHCKLNRSAIFSFVVGEGERVTLFLKKSDRWQNVTDWLRKDCKLKIRVMN